MILKDLLSAFIYFPPFFFRYVTSSTSCPSYFRVLLFRFRKTVDIFLTFASLSFLVISPLRLFQRSHSPSVFKYEPTINLLSDDL